MKEEKNYYDILGVKKTASKDEIKKAFKKIARHYHPDAHPTEPDAEMIFKDASTAYEVLSDDTKRQNYDTYGSPDGPQGFSGGGGFDPFDMFRGFGFGNGGFGSGGFGGNRRRGPSRGSDTQQSVTISLNESVFGCKKDINITRQTKCKSCGGNGGEGIVSCPECGGTGVRTVTQGIMRMQTTCLKCHGTGKVPEKPCNSCHGSGFELKEDTLRVTIPAGILDGMSMTLRGKGNESLDGGENGDVYLSVHVQNDTSFAIINETDLGINVNLTYPQLALGTQIFVPTIDGNYIKLTIPPSTQPGSSLKARGKGLGILNSNSRGDLWIKLNVAPVDFNDEQKEMLRKLDETLNPTDKPSVERYH